jgi:hypothetical protein
MGYEQRRQRMDVICVVEEGGREGSGRRNPGIEAYFTGTIVLLGHHRSKG